MAIKGMLAHKHLQDSTVTRALLSAAVIVELDQIATNTTAIGTNATNLSNHIAQKGQADGFAPLNANTKLPTSYLEASALAEYKGEPADEAAMVALSGVGPTDWVFRQDSGTIYFFTSGDSTDAANWTEMSAPNTGVISVNGQTGAITLAAVASSGDANDLSNLAAVGISGDAADLTGLSAVATSGMASDVAFADATDQFVATTVSGALAEAMTAVGTATQAAADAETASTLVSGSISGAQDDTNKSFTVAGVDPSKQILFFRDGAEVVQAGFATLSGSTVTFIANAAAPASDENLTVVGYPN